MQFQCAVLQQALLMPQDAELDWLLALGDSTITYRSRYMARPEWLPVLDLMVRDDSNPRSIVFQAKGLSDQLARLGGTLCPCGEELLAPAMTALAELDPDADLQPGSERLDSVLGGLQAGSSALSEQLSLRFFSHSLLRRTIAT